MNLPEKVSEKLRRMPDEPGCYIMRDRAGRIIYVGKASSLRKRVQFYFRQATLRGADPKLRGLIKSVHDIDCMVVRNMAEAGLTEGRLIKDYKPRYNVSFKDDKRFLLMRGESDQPFPRLKLCRIKRDDGAIYFGPYASSAAARAALDFAEKTYGLRKCAPRVPDGETYRHCLNDIIRWCSAPCAGKTSEREYREKFDEACAFLRGERPARLQELRARMIEASDRREFEKAAALRDTLLLLTAAVKQRARVSKPPEMRREERKAGIEEIRAVLGIERVPRVIEAYDVSNISGTYATASMVRFEDGLPQRNKYRRFRIKSVMGIDDAEMMAEAVRRRFIGLLADGAEMPDLILVDGGAAQLSAARAVLKELGINATPAAGLAKRFEELYWPANAAPMRLPEDSPALKTLQRLRDEAHRFALAYHRRLRGRRIRESALDEIPGIGKKRKQRLLEHFGSVTRIKKATAQEIAEVSGIGGEMAKTIVERLK